MPACRDSPIGSHSRLPSQPILKSLSNAFDPLPIPLALILFHPSEKRRLKQDQEALRHIRQREHPAVDVDEVLGHLDVFWDGLLRQILSGNDPMPLRTPAKRRGGRDVGLAAVKWRLIFHGLLARRLPWSGGTG